MGLHLEYCRQDYILGSRRSDIPGRTISSAIHQIQLGDRVIALYVKTKSSPPRSLSLGAMNQLCRRRKTPGKGQISHVIALHVKPKASPCSSVPRIRSVTIGNSCSLSPRISSVIVGHPCSSVSRICSVSGTLGKSPLVRVSL